MPRALPRPDKILARWKAEDITGIANGGNVASWTDGVSGIVATAPVGHVPTYVAAGSHGFLRPAVRFQGGRRFLLPSDSRISAALSAGLRAAVHIIYRRPLTEGLGFFFGRANIQISAGGTSDKLNFGNSSLDQDPHCDTATEVMSITLGIRGDVNVGGGWALANGTRLPLFGGGGWDGTGSIAIGAVGDVGSDPANSDFASDVEIEEVILYSEPIYPWEGLALHYYSCEAAGQPLPIAGLKRFLCINGDSQTENNYPAKYAASRGIRYGAFTNVGKSGYTLAHGDNGGNNITDLAPSDTDGYAAVTGLPTLVVIGEYYNRGTNDDDVGGGGSDSLLAQNVVFNTGRKAANPSTRLLWWTSLASWDRDGGARDHYNDKLTNVAGHYGADRVVPVHLDPNIGVHGAAPTTSDGTNTYFADGVHLNFSVGTDKMVELLGPAIDEELARPYVTQITGPATAGFGTGPVTLTVGIDAPADKDITINILRSGASGSLSATAVVLHAGEQSKTVTFTPAAVGIATFTTTNDDNLYNGSFSLAVLQIVLTPPSAFQHWLPTNMSVAITSGLVAGVDITLSDNDAGGTFTPETVSVSPGHLAAGFTYLAAQAQSVTITVGAPGYQPVSAVVPVVDPGPIDGDGAYAAFPAPLTAAIPIDPAGDPLIAMPFDPSDARRLKADFTVPLAGKTIASLKSIGFDDAAGALGWRISVGYDRPILDKTNNCVVARVECDPAFAQVAAYSGSGFVAAPRAQIETTDGELIERSFPFATRQL